MCGGGGGGFLVFGCQVRLGRGEGALMNGQCRAEPRHVHEMCMIVVITLHAARRDAGSPAAGSGRV